MLLAAPPSRWCHGAASLPGTTIFSIHGPAGDRRGVHRPLSAPLVALHIGGADKLLPATFLVIVGTVAIYGLAAAPLARALGLRQAETEKNPGEQPPLNPLGTDGGPVGPSAATRAG